VKGAIVPRKWTAEQKTEQSKKKRMWWDSLTKEQRLELNQAISEGQGSMTEKEKASMGQNISKAKTDIPNGPRNGSDYSKRTLRGHDDPRGKRFRQQVVVERDGGRCRYPYSACFVTQQELDSNPILEGAAKSLHIHHLLPVKRFKRYYDSLPDLYYQPRGVITLCPIHHKSEDERLKRMTDDEVIAEFEAKAGIKLK
jgi:hypothetical protein